LIHRLYLRLYLVYLSNPPSWYVLYYFLLLIPLYITKVIRCTLYLIYSFLDNWFRYMWSTLSLSGPPFVGPIWDCFLHLYLHRAFSGCTWDVLFQSYPCREYTFINYLVYIIRTAVKQVYIKRIYIEVRGSTWGPFEALLSRDCFDSFLSLVRYMFVPINWLIWVLLFEKCPYIYTGSISICSYCILTSVLTYIPVVFLFVAIVFWQLLY